MDLERILRSKLRAAGRTYARTRRSFQEGRNEGSIPEDERGRAKIVCRRYAERRAVELDAEKRPACFDPDHPDCQGCVEDIRKGRIETWDRAPGAN
jgi:hypothetical protein